MKNLRNFALRSQATVLVALIVVFVIGGSVFHGLRNQTRSDLATSFHRDISLATTPQRLKSLLRNLDLVTAQYLAIGKPEWLEDHKRILAEIHEEQAELVRLFPNGRERHTLQELDRRLAEHFIKESEWIRQRRAGRLTAAEAARLLSARRGYEEVLETVLGMHNVDLRDLSKRMRAADGEAYYNVIAVLLSGLLLSALLALALSRYIIRPISTLAEYATHWRPGQPWNCEVPSVSPEINGLFGRMKELMHTINEEYRKERDMNRLKSQFVSLVSHELNNAISVIHAASANLEGLDPEPKDEKREKMYRIIKGQTRSLSNAINNLLNAGRLESGRLALGKKKMEMRAVLRKSLELLEVLYENKGLHVTMSLPDASIPVYADPDALALVATNLLSNAIKYTPQGGTISVGIARERRDGDFVRVYIQDTGIGIKPEDRERIFSGYYRSEAGQLLAHGFGIGLSLAKSIIEAHGGRLELESEPGKGSTFSFLLPVWQADFDAKRAKQGVRNAPNVSREPVEAGVASN